uniref:Cytochrome P450 n=1 Tax=Globodera pallida TaxID=36090 RepID=A0A183C5D3_GLOPA
MAHNHLLIGNVCAFHWRSLVWDIKRRLLHSLPQQLDKAFNYGPGSCLHVTEGLAKFLLWIGYRFHELKFNRR